MGRRNPPRIRKEAIMAEKKITTETEKLDFAPLDELKTAFIEQLESVTERLDKIEKAIRPTSTNKAKKEVTDD